MSALKHTLVLIFYKSYVRCDKLHVHLLTLSVMHNHASCMVHFVTLY